ncbi:MAG: flagellar export chaperone FliS [Bdellovibrionales bacterium GWA1_52_35]|nr:MAG: flagellar export chaperone FliS [Bdellovibrionales bacterium GWA1_52_35]HCM41095.1 flagellar export chaperone FliS [Bdellovibrionales bacterium]
MAGPYGANQYKQTSIMTASKGQILLMLYEAAIRNVKKASLAIEKNDMVTKGTSIGKAHDILNELVNTLDFEVGGNIAQELERLYSFMIETLIKANIENSKDKLANIQHLLETLLEGWRGAVMQVNKSTAAK